MKKIHFVLGVMLASCINNVLAQTFSTTLPIRPDNDQLCDGTIGSVYSIKFGNSGTGEAIMSKKTAGVNQHGIDLFTYFQPRLRIYNNGYVGIGTADMGLGINNPTNTYTPQAMLHVISNELNGLSRYNVFRVQGPGLSNFRYINMGVGYNAPSHMEIEVYMEAI